MQRGTAFRIEAQILSRVKIQLALYHNFVKYFFHTSKRLIHSDREYSKKQIIKIFLIFNKKGLERTNWHNDGFGFVIEV